MNITDPEAIARAFHETYERLAPEHGYETRKASARPWEEVPENNRRLMIAVAAEVAPLIAAQALRSRDDDLAEALRSARSTLTLSSQDWSVRHDLAWLYGILVGWDDDEDDVVQCDAMASVAARCGWNDDAVARLRRLRAAVAGATS